MLDGVINAEAEWRKKVSLKDSRREFIFMIIALHFPSASACGNEIVRKMLIVLTLP